MGTYESYQDYKNSKNNWIGNVPTHWNIQRADFLIQTNRRQVSAESLDGVELIHYSIPNVQEFGTGKLENGDQIDSAKLLISEQQLLVSKLNPRKSTLCIAVPNDQYTVVASSEFVPLLAGKTHLEYSYYVWGSDKVTKLLSSMVQSVTRSHQRVNPSDILKIYWAWPPIHEQKAIARFLDHKTTQIDALIAKKQSLLDKLAEQRTALISQAVTKGLDPSVPMKDSGVDWLGKIPAHWTVPNLGYVAEVRGGVTKGRKLPNEETVEVPYLRVANVQDGFIDLSHVTNIEILATELERYSLQKGDVLMNEGGDNDKLGRGAVWEGEIDPCLHQNHVFAVRPRIPEFSDWLALLTQSGYAKFYFFTTAKQSTNLASISSSNIKRLPVLLPPETERREILDHVKTSLDKLTKQRERVIQVIERLKEYRAALITNAVTGKIDVRDFCIPTTTEQKELAHG